MESIHYSDVVWALSPTTQLFVDQLVHGGEAYAIVHWILHMVQLPKRPPDSRKLDDGMHKMVLTNLKRI